MIEVVAKSSQDYKQIENKISLGAKYIELQLMTEEELIDVDKIEGDTGIYIKNVHTPITDTGDIDVINVLDDDTYAYLYKLFKTMNNNHMVDVILHTGKVCTNFGMLIGRLRSLLEINQNTRICLENSTILYGYRDSEKVYVSNYHKETLKGLIDQLRRCLDTDRIVGVFDVCHALSSVNIINDVFGGTANLESYFKAFKNSGICHFSTCIGSGSLPEHHGLVFDSYEDFKKIYELYKKYMPNATFVIEMQEKDYYKSLNFKKTLEYVKRYERVQG